MSPLALGIKECYCTLFILSVIFPIVVIVRDIVPLVIHNMVLLFSTSGLSSGGDCVASGRQEVGSERRGYQGEKSRSPARLRRNLHVEVSVIPCL